MKKKIKIFVVVYMAIAVSALFYSRLLAAVLFSILVLFGLAGAVLLVLNRLYKTTNHWKNQFLFEKNFISGQGYRENLNRNLDIVNLGSNPAKFGFFYENVRGQNWATGSQGLEMDFEILKYYHSYLRNGGIVLIPIMPFTAISQYIKTKNGYWNDSYYIKFAKILDHSQGLNLPGGKNLYRMLKFPVLFQPKLIGHILADVPKDNGLQVGEQTMMKPELEQDASNWIRGWMREFDVSSMQEFLSEKFDVYREEAGSILNEMIRFCRERELKPVLITVPMSEYLASKFNDEFRNRMVKDFVNEVNVYKIPFLDYMFDERFSDPALYDGSFFLNLKGRKEFSAKVIRDLDL